MFQACEDGDIALVKHYLNTGVDPNYQHPEFMTSVLIESVRSEQIDMIKLLLAHGADPHLAEVWGTDTPVSAAKTIKNKTIMALLTTT